MHAITLLYWRALGPVQRICVLLRGKREVATGDYLKESTFERLQDYELASCIASRNVLSLSLKEF